MTHPELYFEIWKQENRERVRAAALRRAVLAVRRSQPSRPEQMDQSATAKAPHRAFES